MNRRKKGGFAAGWVLAFGLSAEWGSLWPISASLWQFGHAVPVQVVIPDEILLAVGIPAAPIYGIDQVVADPHIGGAREMFVDTVHPKAGPIKLTGSHIKFSETKTAIRSASPGLGEHNEAILTSLLGKTKEEIETLKQEGVI